MPPQLFDLSNLRLAGILLGAAALVAVFFRLRSHAPSRMDVWTLFFFGAAMILLGVYPGAADLPSELFDLREKESGRIITLLVISTALLWFMLIGERGKRQARDTQFDRFVRSVIVNDHAARLRARVEPGATLVIIPALDEAKNLAEVIPRIPAAIMGRPVRALVIDDGSADGTAAVAEQKKALAVRHPFNRGGGAALRTGYDLSMALGAEVVVTMDADGQHQPEEIERLIEPIIKNEADIVIGSRVLGAREKDSMARWMGINLFSSAVSAITGVKVSDCSSGFRAFRLSELGRVTLVQDQFHTAELIIDAAKKGLRIVERPITITRRLGGASKKGHNFLYGLNFLVTILKSWLR